MPRGKNGSVKHAGRAERLEQAFLRLEAVHRDSNTRLDRIEDTLKVSSRVFELMHERLEQVEATLGVVVVRLERIDEGQKLVIDRLDRLVAASTRDRTEHVEKLARLEQRVETLERTQ